jgi:hypothetical protein
MKEKFKVGDRVEIKSWEEMEKEFGLIFGEINCRCHFTPTMKYLCGRTATIKTISEYKRIELDNWSNNDNTNWNYSTDMIKRVQPKQFTKSDLKERNVVKFRNGEEAAYDAIVKNETVENYVLGFIKDGKLTGKYVNMCNYNEDLIHKYNKNLDIIEIWKQHYSKTWERTEEDKPIEMTVSEIEEKLGHKVKVVADDREN